MISRQQLSVPEYYRNYVAQAGDDDLLKALRQNTRQFKKLLKDLPKKKIDYAYAPGKWTIRELLQHIIDAERVFVLRAVWFARRDASPQPSFDEKVWASNANVSNRKWKSMVEEFFALRAATELFFESLDDDQLKRTGIASNNEMSVATVGFICAGHAAHHVNLIKERYLPNKKAKSNGHPKA